MILSTCVCVYVVTGPKTSSAQSSDIDRRISRFQESLKNNPFDTKSRMELGELFFLQNNYDAAAKQFQKAINSDPNFLTAYLSLASTLQKKDRPDYAQAQTVLEKALKISPQNASIYLNLGYLHIKQAKIDKSLEEFQQALKITSNPAILASAHLGIASIYQAQKDVNKANAEYEEAFKIDPNLKNVLIDLENKKAAQLQNAELPIGRAVDFMITQQFLPFDNPKLNDSISFIAANLVKNSDNPQLKFTVKVLNAQDEINTFCAPGGYIYVTTGALNFIGSAIPENQKKDVLAFLLGHEIGHLEKQHGLRRLKRMELFNKIQMPLMELGMVGLAGLSGVAANNSSNPLTGQLIAQGGCQLSPALLAASTTFVSELAYKGYCRKEEYEADKIGLKCALKAGYDPQAAAIFFAKLEGSKEYRSQIAKNKSFSVHPSLEKRIVNIERLNYAEKK